MRAHRILSLKIAAAATEFAIRNKSIPAQIWRFVLLLAVLSRLSIPVFMFAAAFILVPVFQLGNLEYQPGDIGDARLNNYFLEHVYQFLVGGSNSLWHSSFFFPFPYVLGFSDNLFGSAPVYIVARLFNNEPDTSFQIWFLFGYFANFIAAYYALRRLSFSRLAASTGAVIYAFALPTTAHAGHAQLHYRFGLPLAIVFFIEFLQNKKWNYFLLAAGWLLWQFYAGVYMGFFTMLLMFTTLLSFLALLAVQRDGKIQASPRHFIDSWMGQARQQRALGIGVLVALITFLVLLFWPYLQVSILYGASRSWAEISTMLPRPQSYFLSDSSLLWKTDDASIFREIPMRHEHQMFIGIGPLALAVLGLFVGRNSMQSAVFPLMAGMLGFAIILTINIGGLSLWYLFFKIPLASAIRAFTRLDQAILFPIAFLAAVGIDYIRKKFAYGIMFISLALLIVLAESSLASMPTSSKESWRSRIAHASQIVPDSLPIDAVLFVAQQEGPFFADELDAMWVALNRGRKTLNGYSGLYPPGYALEYGRDCSELARRIISYINFATSSERERDYKNIVSKVVPVGFESCGDFQNVMPLFSSVDRVYTRDEVRYLSYHVVDLIERDGQISGARVRVINPSTLTFAARSNVGKPLRFSWRFLNASGEPLSGWDTRKDLPLDIPSNGTRDVVLNFDMPRNAASLEVSMVQELVFWAHDIGIKPVSATLR